MVFQNGQFRFVLNIIMLPSAVSMTIMQTESSVDIASIAQPV